MQATTKRTREMKLATPKFIKKFLCRIGRLKSSFVKQVKQALCGQHPNRKTGKSDFKPHYCQQGIRHCKVSKLRSDTLKLAES